jgi:peptidoglycan biosynthesis protein MviN/MurJ (putative lipid II flippase)
VFFLSVPSAAALIVLAGPILRLLWRSGKFGEGAIDAAEFCLLYYALALIALSGLQVVNRAFYSLKDAKVPPLVGIGYTGVTVGLALLSVRVHSSLQYAGIAAATSVGVTIGMIVMFELLRRRMNGVDGRAITASFLRVLVASVVLAGVSLAVSRWLGAALGVPATHFAGTAPQVLAPPEGAARAYSIFRVALQVLASLAAGGVSYLLVLHLLGAPELASFRELMRRRRRSAQAVSTR